MNSTPPFARLPWTLVSKSPRRLALLRQVGIEPRVIAADVSEREEGVPARVAEENAAAKLEAALEADTLEGIVLAADTVVVMDDAILNKPENDDQAASMIRRLAGREHTVVTGVALAWWGEEIREAARFHERTAVRMREVGEEEIAAYVASGEGRDKAGGYGIQGRAGAFVEGVRGCYFNVVGLPLARTLATVQDWLASAGHGEWEKP